MSAIRAGYKHTEVGVIPVDWDVTTLLHVAKTSMQNGLFFKPELKGAGVKLINVGDLFSRYPIDTESLELFRATAKEVERFGVCSGDLFFTRSSIVPSGIAHCNTYISRSSEPVVFDSHIIRFRPNAEIVQSSYLFRFCGASIARQYLVSNAKTGTMTTIDQGVLGKCPVLIPPKEEQEAIAEALSDADALIESLEQLLEKKRHLKQGAMQELLTGKKRLPGFSGEWSSRLLGELIESCSSGATPYRGRPDYYVGDVKWITSGELKYNVIHDTIEHISNEAALKTNLKIHPVGTFLIAITGLEAAGTRGSCGFVGSPATTNQSCMAIYPSPELDVQYLYQYYVLHGDELALRYCQGTKQQSYTAKLVKLLPIDLPPSVEEQSAIAALLSDMDAEIAELELELAKTRALKQGMMQKLLTGEIRLI